jgi:hypothetical protein
MTQVNGKLIRSLNSNNYIPLKRGLTNQASSDTQQYKNNGHFQLYYEASFWHVDAVMNTCNVYIEQIWTTGRKGHLGHPMACLSNFMSKLDVYILCMYIMPTAGSGLWHLALNNLYSYI